MNSWGSPIETTTSVSISVLPDGEVVSLTRGLRIRSELKGCHVTSEMTRMWSLGDQGSRKQPKHVGEKAGQVRGLPGPLLDSVATLCVPCHLQDPDRTQPLSLLISSITLLALPGTQFQVSMKKNRRLLSGVSPVGVFLYFGAARLFN